MQLFNFLVVFKIKQKINYEKYTIPYHLRCFYDQ